MSDPFREVSLPAPGGVYASADDLLLVSDLCEIDLRINRWKKNGASLRIRVRALDFSQQERIDRAALVKIEVSPGQYQMVRSESRFAVGTLKEAVIVPTLTDAQAREMAKHNPGIITAIVRFVWDMLSNLDQESINAIVESEIPDINPAPDDTSADADRADEPIDGADAIPAYGLEPIDDPGLDAA